MNNLLGNIDTKYLTPFKNPFLKEKVSIINFRLVLQPAFGDPYCIALVKFENDRTKGEQTFERKVDEFELLLQDVRNFLSTL